MNLNPIDLAIIAGYLILTLGLGFWVSRLSSPASGPTSPQ